MEKESRKKISKQFSSHFLKPETQNIYGGTGLGLSITSKLVHRLGGTISLDSELGKFADFTVNLPMNGNYVDVENISKSLKNTTIVLVEPKRADDCASLSFPFKAEPLPLDSAMVDFFGLNVTRCHSLDELNGNISVENDQKGQQHFTLLVHETLHELCTSEKMNSVVGQSQCAFITYGANFLVEKTKTSHFKSLTGLLPATLLASISKQISEQSHMKTNALLKSKQITPSNGLFSALQTGTVISDTCVGDTTEKPMRNTERTGPHPKTMQTRSKTSSSSNRKTKEHDFRKDMKVLYAEDNIVNQKVLSRVLTRSGITDITIVDNGKKAVDISETIRYDCILLDMQMPVMDGMEACKLIMERDPDSIIVFVTAHALDEFKNKAKAAGAKGFISKPFRVGDIDDVLKNIYSKQSKET